MLCSSCDWVTNTVLFVSFVIGVLYLWLKYEYGYWQKRGVYSPPAQFPTGHLGRTGFKESIGLRVKGLYEQNKQHPFVGLVLGLKKSLLVNDLDLVKSILLKDFDHFQSHGIKMDNEADPLAGHLFNLDGEEWKKLRVKLTPTFTSSKMKYMFDTMLGCSKDMIKYIDDNVESGKLLDLKEVIAKFGTDVIASCAFGIQTNSFKYPDAEFRRMGKRIFETNSVKIIVDLWSLLYPKTVPKQLVQWINGDIQEFFTKTIRNTIEEREQSKIVRNDFLQLLINMKNSDVKSGNHLTMEELLPQVFIFFAAGFETSSTVATYAFLELAKNRKLQDKAQEQIDRAMEEAEGGTITYETLNTMTYLTQIVEESMRMYPPLPFIFRICNKDYKIPGTEVVIEKDTQILISALGIQRDPEIYPDPMTFDPDRFTPENKAKRHQFSHIPFGEGPRICIGSRFGIMQVKLGLFMILRHFNVELSEQSSKPVVYDPTAFLLHTKGDMLMKLTPRAVAK